MENIEKFVNELEKLIKKHRIEKCVAIIPLDEEVKLCCSAPTHEEELETSKEFTRLMNCIGSFETENIKVLNDFLEDLIVRSEQESDQISQVTWERIALENAETFLTEDEYERLENCMILKSAAMDAGNFDSASNHREEELRLLKKVIVAMEE